MDKIVKDLSNSSGKALLICGWIFLALTLLINLISHLASSSLYKKTIAEIQNKDDFYPKLKTRSYILSVINWITLFFLGLGLLLIIIFTSINL